MNENRRSKLWGMALDQTGFRCANEGLQNTKTPNSGKDLCRSLISMATTLTYGKATTCLLDSADATLLSPQLIEALTDEQLTALVKEQLAKPADFPPLSQATIPGDTVVLPVGPGVPQLATVLDGVLQALRHAGVEDSLITILLTESQPDCVENLAGKLKALGHEHCRIEVHNPDNEKEIAFLGVSQAGDPMRLNRELCDADFVLPIAVTTGELQQDAKPPNYPGLYPCFSDRETIKQFATATAEHFPATGADGWSEIESCGRQLGVGLALQVVPAMNGEVASVLAGDSVTIAKRSQKNYREIWGQPVNGTRQPSPHDAHWRPGTTDLAKPWPRVGGGRSSTRTGVLNGDLL